MKLNWWEYLGVGLFLALCLGFGLYFARLQAPEPVIGVIRFQDTVTLESASTLNALIEAARQDDRVAGIALEVLSPGGLATSSESIFYSLLNLREEKPVVVAIESLAVSGGYYMAVAGNRIYMPSSAYVGNVGTRGARPSDPAISSAELSSGPFKLAGGNRFDRIQQLDIVKDAFVGNVVHQRSHAEVNPLTIDADTVAEARIYLGSEAIAVGLADAEGSIIDAISAAAELAGVDRYKTVELVDYFDMEPEVAVPLESSIRAMAQEAGPEAVFLLDSRIPLPGVADSTDLERHLLNLRAVDSGSLSPIDARATNPFRD